MIRSKPIKRGGRTLRPKGGLKRTVGQIKPKKPKEKSISKLIKEADALFSKRVRGENADSDGICTCFTCGFRAPLKRVQCGHYLSRFYKAARWHKDNARTQCWMCNIYKKGDAVGFRMRLVSEIGEARVLAVEELRNAPIKLTREYLTNLILSL